MPVTLSDLISHVEQAATSEAPLDLLAAASATASEVTDATDALLSHFVDRCRRAGHSWAEIGGSLGVTKQAVQQRFTAMSRRDPAAWDRFTDRVQRVCTVHAEAAATELGHNYIGTEHLLLAMYGEPDALATAALRKLGVERDAVLSAIEARVPRGHQGLGGITPRAWLAMETSWKIALRWGHNYVGTEHLAVSLVSGVGGIAEAILAEHGVTKENLEPAVLALLPAH